MRYAASGHDECHSGEDVGDVDAQVHGGGDSPRPATLLYPKKPLLDVLGLTRRERIYWTARKNRFIRDEQRRNQQAQAAMPVQRAGA